MSGIRWPVAVLAVGTGSSIVAAALAVSLFPHAVAGIGGVALLSATVLLLGGYLAYAVRLARGTLPSATPWPWFGVAAAACWSAEIWAGGPARLDHAAERATGAAFALAATVVTVAAGVVGGLRAGSPRGVWHSGLLAGTVSGAFVYAFAVFMTLATLPVLSTRADYRAQYHTSHLPTMHDFLVNDILGAAAAHLVINVMLGVVGAAAGRALLAVRPRSAAT